MMSTSTHSNNSSACNAARSAFRYLVLTDRNRTDQEGLFPQGEISLVLGPSGAGKTTWLLQFIQAWYRGDPLFSRPVCPSEFLFLSFDRSEDSLERTAERLGLDLKTLPHWTPQTLSESQSTPKRILQKLLKLPKYRNVKAVFI
jgi:KaiC/GvpD/RAD55 family RecA-like ATPase